MLSNMLELISRLSLAKHLLEYPYSEIQPQQGRETARRSAVIVKPLLLHAVKLQCLV